MNKRKSDLCIAPSYNDMPQKKRLKSDLNQTIYKLGIIKELSDIKDYVYRLEKLISIMNRNMNQQMGCIINQIVENKNIDNSFKNLNIDDNTLNDNPSYIG
jgi:hypothetical protein